MFQAFRRGVHFGFVKIWFCCPQVKFLLLLLSNATTVIINNTAEKHITLLYLKSICCRVQIVHNLKWDYILINASYFENILSPKCIHSTKPTWNLVGQHRPLDWEMQCIITRQYPTRRLEMYVSQCQGACPMWSKPWVYR